MIRHRDLLLALLLALFFVTAVTYAAEEPVTETTEDQAISEAAEQPAFHSAINPAFRRITFYV